MSWGRKDNTRYNRSEETHYWQTLIEEQTYWDCPWQDDWDDDEDRYWWTYFGAPGYVGSMKEYHQMKVLTLLRKFDLKTARQEANSRGW